MFEDITEIWYGGSQSGRRQLHLANAIEVLIRL